MGNFFSQLPQTKGDDGIILNQYKKLPERRFAATDNATGRTVCEPFLPETHGLPILIRKEDRGDSTSVLSLKVGDGRIRIFDITPVRYAALRPKVPCLYKKLYENTNKYETSYLDFARKKIFGLQLVTQLVRMWKGKPKDDQKELFRPLKLEDDVEVFHALYDGNSQEILVTHKPSNIVISRGVFRCLSPGAWLNDEVINLYLELLKERERRNHVKFLKCHFFNTFFYKKLTNGKNDYDFRAVRRWTTINKLGYTLIECDKVFVPIHKDVHWCLAVINIKDETFQYLDSLGGMDTHVLNVLKRYLVEETRDKGDRGIDCTSWKNEPVNDLPLQKNWCDCGMFMIKYIDFYSRGLKLCFAQEHMEYFRKKTAHEILRLRAE